MLKIGEFASLTGISIHMLRNYDKIGLLIPEYVDSVNNYRFYSENQIVTANRIQELLPMMFEEVLSKMTEGYKVLSNSC